MKRRLSAAGPQGEGRDSGIVMTGFVPVIHVVKLPESLQSGQKRRHVDGRDEPGHDGKGGLSAPYPYIPRYESFQEIAQLVRGARVISAQAGIQGRSPSAQVWAPVSRV